MGKQTVHLIAAARPNFMKVAPLWHALAAAEDFTPVLVHTGQHYDANMAGDILADLKLPAPDHSLGVGGGNHGEQTGRVMIAYEPVALAERPDWIVVVGDVNATIACALVGAKLGIPVVHLEAGLRSRDRTMPEEINRLATDVVSDVLWTPSPDADENLAAEGIDPANITRVGNIMLDSFEMVAASDRGGRRGDGARPRARRLCGGDAAPARQCRHGRGADQRWSRRWSRRRRNCRSSSRSIRAPPRGSMRSACAAGWRRPACG